LRNDILRRKYVRGQKLTEQDICIEYQASRTPVREALKKLEAEGLIEIIPHKGAFVLGFSDQEIRDIYELRKCAESLAIKWAVERITKEELDALEEIFEFMEFYTQNNDIEKMVKINTSFHQLIYDATHNKLLRNILSSYQLYLEQAKAKGHYGDDYLPRLLEEHRLIFEAIKRKDTESAIEAIERHIDNSIERSVF
jgi:DNA-binding GntR family transcriptional regulator